MQQTYRQSSRRLTPWLVVLMLVGFVGYAQPTYAAEVVLDTIQVNSGGEITMRASGFGNREVVNSWVSSGTDATVITTADAVSTAGGAVYLTLKVGRFWQPGWWAITIRGSKSNAKAIGTFEILATPPDGVVNSDRSEAYPSSRINFRGTGYAAGEIVTVWATLPDRTAVASPLNLRANATGDVYFYYDLPAGALAGQWYMTAYGLESQRLLVGTFTVLR